MDLKAILFLSPLLVVCLLVLLLASPFICLYFIISLILDYKQENRIKEMKFELLKKKNALKDGNIR